MTSWTPSFLTSRECGTERVAMWYNSRMKICMVTSSYPKYEGDVTAPFIESIAASVAADGNEVHVLAPYHPDVRRAAIEKGVHMHFFKYIPFRNLNIWGYAESL